jgi:phage terminase small subunit
MAKKRKLTPIREIFCQHYTKSWNATQAAKDAGYKPKWAQGIGYTLVHNNAVKERISELTEHSLKEIGVTRERVLKELATIAFTNMSDLASWNDSGVRFLSSAELDENKKAAISEVTETLTQVGGTLKIKQHDKVKALETLAKHLKMLTERHEVSGPNGKPIENKNISETTDEELDQKIKLLLSKGDS